MPTVIDVRDLPDRFADVVARALAEGEVIVTDGSIPRARLVPLTPARPSRVAGLHAGAIQTSTDFDEPLPDEFWDGSR